MSKCYLFTLIGVSALILEVHAQDQAGFISLDCGRPRHYTHTESRTGIYYTSDENYIETTGVSRRLEPRFITTSRKEQVKYVRAFPEGLRNCYRFNLAMSNKYLIRAAFYYGNYDNEDKPPTFDVHLGPNLWETVSLRDDSYYAIHEIIHVLLSDYLNVCLVDTGSGTPFISVLELRPLKNTTYIAHTGSLQMYLRNNIAPTKNNYVMRYKEDALDRLWSGEWNLNLWSLLNATANIRGSSDYQLPPLVLKTAATPANSSARCLDYSYRPTDFDTQLYVYMHFAEIQELQKHETRELSICLNGQQWFGPFRPNYSTVYSKTPLFGNQFYNFSICKTSNSSHPPIINGIEFYKVNALSQSQTARNDVDAITNIKSTYRIGRDNWQGDPCVPQEFVWNGLNCSFTVYDAPRIISLNLSSNELTGAIAPSLSNLWMLESLDLSNNKLTGEVPESLTRLTSLTVLNLSGNNLSGSIPPALLEKSRDGSLILSVAGNPHLYASVPRKRFVVPIIASLALLLLLITLLAIFWRIKKRTKGAQGDAKFSIRSGSLNSKNKQYKYAEIVDMTGNFKTLLGQGSFGEVFHGYLDDSTEVAVKMLSTTSRQGYEQFLAEVKLLVAAHHRNLTTFFGYCDERGQIGLVYEFMANGNLQQRLSDSDTRVLSWTERLRIAIEAGQGLEYLHEVGKPPRVHRDIKSANILLNDKLQAKIADFGLSRSFPSEYGSHVSTVIAGTCGYLDPEYSMSNRLTEKSDVYSFGVVILEIITSQPAIIKIDDEYRHISQWVDAILSQGDMRSVVDSRLQGDYDINSAWKAVEIAMLCVSPTAVARPSMNHVVRELKECLAIEMARKEGGEIENQLESIAMISYIDMTPIAR